MFELGFRVYFGQYLFTFMRHTPSHLICSFSATIIASPENALSLLPPHKTIETAVAKPHSLRWSNQVPFFLAKNGCSWVTIQDQQSLPILWAAPIFWLSHLGWPSKLADSCKYASKLTILTTLMIMLKLMNTFNVSVILLLTPS